MSALAAMEQKEREEAGEQVDHEPLDELTELTRENMTWTQDRLLMAQLINRTTSGIMSQLSKKDRPDWPVVGPLRWWPDDQKNKMLPTSTKAEPESGGLMSVLGRMGNMGGNG